jgi:hypothetical protein
VVAGLVSTCNNSSEKLENRKYSGWERIDSIEEKADSVKKVAERIFGKADSAADE